MIFFYYKNLKSKTSTISQDLFDLMFADFENNLREMGFGDIAVNKKMKVFITAFYGRIAQYSKGIENYMSNGDKSLIQQAILNNVYKGNDESLSFIDYFINYMSDNINNFIKIEEKDNLKDSFQYIDIKYES